MNATVVELDTLADADGPAADDQRLLGIQWLGFIFFFVGAVEIRCFGIELCGAGIHHFVNRA